MFIDRRSTYSYMSNICQYENCERTATHIAKGKLKLKGHDLGCYCAEHAKLVSHEGNPEYFEECPNCGCLFGVN